MSGPRRLTVDELPVPVTRHLRSLDDVARRSAAREAPSVPPPPPSTRRALPVFEEGHGERRDQCARYESCLGRWTAMHRRRGEDRPARCPVACEHETRRDSRAERDLQAARRDGSINA